MRALFLGFLAFSAVVMLGSQVRDCNTAKARAEAQQYSACVAAAGVDACWRFEYSRCLDRHAPEVCRHLLPGAER